MKIRLSQYSFKGGPPLTITSSTNQDAVEIIACDDYKILLKYLNTFIPKEAHQYVINLNYQMNQLVVQRTKFVNQLREELQPKLVVEAAKFKEQHPELYI